MSSSPEALRAVEPAGPAWIGSVDATAALWGRRPAGTAAIPFAAALTGTSVAELSDAVAISLAASEEASQLLDGMELRIRTLKTGVATQAERCVFSVRGPVLWSETLTARANALGNEDVFVCATAERTFDTVENRVLVAALEAIARAAQALRGPLRDKVDVAEAARITEVAEDARRWREHPRLAALRSGRLTGRDTARLRGGHRLARMAAVLAVRDRVGEPFRPEDLAGLCDPPTRRLHGFLKSVLDVLAAHGLVDERLILADGELRSGGLSFRHPAYAATGGGVHYRGVPLLPPEDVAHGASWAERMPARGIPIGGPADVERMLARLAERERARRAEARRAPR